MVTWNKPSKHMLNVSKNGMKHNVHWKQYELGKKLHP
jgi:hypothetical protein